ncbi:ETHYLENE-RESPONSIVE TRANSCRIPTION FACTOR CRF5-RELATED [Salix purpurea]|uniref:ETHYLENE-RESPONSIVE TRANSCRIPTION FACTOR CRF5-RELATED n=1 Tax=Salix purpurea TaxID=77065 RepID=A0A9Q0SRB1_SALPP|nr:ETHYLENE-RESPONSIVE TRANSCRIPTION FACTOR CRF5-RELATED [Salix purpurea]
MNRFSTKYTEHKTVTNKLVKWEDSKATRIVRISVTDDNATDSSGDENEESKRASSKSEKTYKRDKNNKFRERQGSRGCKKIFKSGKPATGCEKYFERPELLSRGEKQRRQPWLMIRQLFVLKGPDAQTNFTKPPVSKQHTRDVDINVNISGYDSGKESHNSLCSPTSVLRFQSTEEPGAESQVQSDCYWRIPTQEEVVREESIKVGDDDDECLVTDPSCLGEFWDFENPAPIFFEECSVPGTVSREDYADISVHFDGDFGSCLWDVDKYFEA